MPPARNQPPWRRHLPEVLVASLGLLVVIGLWVHNRSDDGPSSSSPRTETTTPTTRRNDGSTPLIQDEGRTVEGDAAQASSLTEAVAKPSDLPSGWTPVGVSSGGSALCAGHDPTASSTAAARAGFRKNPGTRLLAASVASYASPEAATAAVQKASQDASACTGNGITYTATPLSGVGDQGVKVERTVRIGGKATLRSVALVARVGARVAIVSVSGDPVETDTAMTVLQAEVDRL